MMQQGLMSLPGAGQEQAPGQAAPMAALPQQQPRTPAAMTGRLEGLPPQQLMMMFTNPADTTPKWAVVTAYAKAIEQQRMMDAARGQSAMQQGQAQMGQPPVAAQVMMQPPTQTARHGGIMHGYSGGGAVAFNTGTGPAGVPQPGGYIDPAFRKDQTAANIHAARVELLNREILAAQERAAVATTPEERNRANEDVLSVQRELARITGAPVPPRTTSALAASPAASAPAPATPAKPKPKSDSGVSSLLGAAALAPVPFNPLGMMSALSKSREPAKPDPEKNAREITRLQKLVGDYEAAVAGGDTRPQLLSELATARAALRGRMGAGISTIMTPQQIERAVAPSPEVTPSAPPTVPSPAIAPAAAPTGAPSTAAPPAGITSLPTAPGAEAAAEAERLAKAREAMLEGRRTLPPELLKAREGLSAIEAANIAAQREATGAFGSESLERLQEARRRAQAPRLNDIEYLGRMLEGMKGAKRFGDVLVGGAAGAGRAEGERKAALAQAEKERREDTRLIRAEEAAGRQLQILAAQRELAEKQGDFTRVQAIDDQIAGVREGLAAFKVGRADTEFEQGIKRFAAESGRIAAEAQKEGVQARAAGAAKNPYDTINDNAQKLFSEWLKSPQGMIATPEQRTAAFKEFFRMQAAQAQKYGLPVPADTVEQPKQERLRFNPETGKIE